LNEGFASYFEYKLVEMVHPELEIPGFFNVRKLQNGLRKDSLQSTEPMTTNSSKSSEVNYDKGGSVIRMFEYVVGEEIFRESLSHYLIEKYVKSFVI
jgi:glutamyl aminopeptidase